MKQDKKDHLFKCFCDARRNQAYLSSCLLGAEFSKEEKDFIIEIIQHYAAASEKIKGEFGKCEDS